MKKLLPIFFFCAATAFGQSAPRKVGFAVVASFSEWAANNGVLLIISAILAGIAVKYFLFPRDIIVPEYGFEDFTADNKDLLDTIKAFNERMKNSRPLIKDAELLPYEKSEMTRRTLEAAQYLTDLENVASDIYGQDKVEEISKLSDEVSSAYSWAADFIEIEPDDKKAVEYFNTFADSYDIPAERQKEFWALWQKYDDRIYEDENLAD